MELLFASGNEHKIEEINKLVNNDLLNIKGLKEINFLEEIPETGKTLEENARIKARHMYSLLKKPVFAEDTGLEIFSLALKPGVRTARYAGPSKDPQKNMDKVLYELQGTLDRKARFRAVIALIINDIEYIFEGIVNGRIAEIKKGNGGFGYDPIFIPENYTKTFAELPSNTKSQLSHRARAFDKMISFLKENAYI